MFAREYSKRLGIIVPEQFQAALDRFGLGKFLRAEPIPYGYSKSNVLLISTGGEYVFRGSPFFTDQFSSERFYIKQLHDRAEVPVPWPFLIDPNDEIFGWSYAIMPRMPGLQLADDDARKRLS